MFDPRDPGSLEQTSGGGQGIAEARLGQYQASVEGALARVAADDVMRRIWAYDHTVWKPDPTELADRLGWLRVAQTTLDNLERLTSLVEEVRSEGYTHGLLLGMGGSSLSPEVLRKTFGVANGYLDLTVLDSTDPSAVLDHARRLNPARTLFIVSTKSGSTIETFSFFKFFYNWTAKALGEEEAGRHFVAITDPGSGLEDTARRYSFRYTFLNDPYIGGRYSALSYFGMVPAALIGVDLPQLLERSQAMARVCYGSVPAQDNPAAWLGTAMGKLALEGRDKVTFAISPSIASFGDWVEQLIAESTGKEGKGILPVVSETLGGPGVYQDDRFFVFLELAGDVIDEVALERLASVGHPLVRLSLGDRYDLGGQFFLWEMGTAVAGHLLGINPFDQPNVETAKVLARKMMAEYQQSGRLPELTPSLRAGDIAIYGDVAASTTGDALLAFLDRARPGAYLSIHAYLPPTPETDAALAELSRRLRDRTRLATTVGYGPRFLHSTGQLHKGDAGRGLFIQLTADQPEDAPIPDEAGKERSSISFGILIQAQALGDRQALLDAGRQVIRFHLGGDVNGAIRRMADALT